MTSTPSESPGSDPAHTERAGHDPTVAGTAPDGVPSAETVTPDRREVVAREREQFGGIKPFVAFFGWLTATGMAVLLTAVVAAIGAGVGLGTNTSSAAEAADTSGFTADEIGWAGVALILVVVFVSYYAGGYVAGRMARFDGLRQGVAVWVWAILIAILVGVLGALAGSQYNVLDNVNGFPRVPSSIGDLSVQGVVAILGVLVISLVGAMLGGLAGMHFHRKVDKAGLGR